MYGSSPACAANNQPIAIDAAACTAHASASGCRIAVGRARDGDVMQSYKDDDALGSLEQQTLSDPESDVSKLPWQPPLRTTQRSPEARRWLSVGPRPFAGLVNTRCNYCTVDLAGESI